MPGTKDSPLSSIGREQTLRLSEKLHPFDLDLIYTSSTNRTIETTNIINEQRNLIVTKSNKLLEMNFGEWEGLTRSQIKETFNNEYKLFETDPANFVAPTGESLVEVKARVIQFINELLEKHNGKNVLVVTHSIVLKILMANFEGRPLAKMWNESTIHSTN
ncbi:histidine phosphatase family protein [Bacillus spongiae]|uniref:Histidine phosphatase family protein n=1 Tax=Bacillus spongiae TaxID=2683610 RepID=A0ABU8HGJ6_9BACI